MKNDRILPLIAGIGMVAWTCLSVSAACNFQLKSCAKETTSCGDPDCSYMTYSPVKYTCYTVGWTTGWTCNSHFNTGTQTPWTCPNTTCNTTVDGCGVTNPTPPPPLQYCTCATPVKGTPNVGVSYNQDTLSTCGS